VLPTADIAHGQKVAAKCEACHAFAPASADTIGPALFGVVGSRPGGHPGYRYSPAMQAFARTHSAWTYDLLYRYLSSPGLFMPGTKMTFYGLRTAQDRIDLIAYLRTNGSESYPIPAPDAH
jgi:cytochrome c